MLLIGSIGWVWGWEEGCASEGVHLDGVVCNGGSGTFDVRGVSEVTFFSPSSTSMARMACSVELVGAPTEMTSARRMALSVELEGEPHAISDVSDLVHQ